MISSRCNCWGEKIDNKEKILAKNAKKNIIHWPSDNHDAKSSCISILKSSNFKYSKMCRKKLQKQLQAKRT